MKLVLQLVLWVVIAFLGYLLFNSIWGEVKFNETKRERYVKVIKNMRDIRKAELAHKTVTGKTALYKVDTMKEIVVIDTLGTRSVKDSLFKGDTRYKKMIEIPIDGVTEKLVLDAGKIEKNNTIYPVFEITVEKATILFDQPKDYVTKEKLTVSVEEINGPLLRIGSMDAISTVSNFPKIYDEDDE